jgi:hypothetical protein
LITHSHDSNLRPRTFGTACCCATKPHRIWMSLYLLVPEFYLEAWFRTTVRKLTVY